MSVEDILSRYDEKITTLALQAREFLLLQLNNIIESPDSSANLIGYGYGTGYKDTICTLLLSKKGIKIGFYKGTELPDPSKLLTGTGKMHKYVEIRTASDMANPALRELIASALETYRQRKK
jgi:hypothetical protein